MTSAEIRQSFLDFFKSKGHTIVPSSSLMPDSPGLLFTNAGMNQFVPIFLNQHAPDVDKWPGAIAGKPTRAADTQKCIRAGGKHNDLEDVGLDTYHHTFFEMLGNWSFGDYFKKEAIDWAWELITEVWKFPNNRLYATVYNPDKSKGDPSEFDQEAYDFWAAKFSAAGLDPKIHIVYGNKKDNFWMMGETGPCGPCSELHVDLTAAGDTKGSLVNKGSADCIEIWNLVFIQFNANPDGTFSPLPAKHVDTGMGFERVTGIIQNTQNFKHFNKVISNYETDIFRPLFDELEKLSGKKYGSTLPSQGAVVASAVYTDIPEDPGLPDDEHPARLDSLSEQQKIDIAFRVIADHIRTLSFSIADGILPGNNDRNYVLRRILRRAVRYGRTLGFHEPFFYKLVDVLAQKMGDVFPELRARKKQVQDAIRTEEEAFNKTLDNGIAQFENMEMRAHARAAGADRIGFMAYSGMEDAENWGNTPAIIYKVGQQETYRPAPLASREGLIALLKREAKSGAALDGFDTFTLYDTYGFPLDLTELMARERGLTVDKEGFEKLMDEQRARARAAQKKEIISASNIDTSKSTRFVGFEELRTPATVLDVVAVKEKTAVILDVSPFYAEMGGQVGDIGELHLGSNIWRIVNTQKLGGTFLHFLADNDAPASGAKVELRVDAPRRAAIQRHHTVTHLLHWALHEVVSRDATQKGSYVGPDKLTFDFSSAALTVPQINEIDKLVNERILENAPVIWVDVPYAEVKGRKDIMQFFGEKYGDVVRVVQIGGSKTIFGEKYSDFEFDGYSKELCGGTHVRRTGDIGSFRIISESAVAAGIRRIEAVAGLARYDLDLNVIQKVENLAKKLNTPVGEIERKIDALLDRQKDLEKQLKAVQQKQAAELAQSLSSKAQQIGSNPAIIENLGPVDGDFLQSVADALKGHFKGVVVLGGSANGAVSLVATVSSEFISKVQAGKIVQSIAPIVGGKGGGKPDNARGGGKDVTKLDEALSKAKELIA